MNRAPPLLIAPLFALAACATPAPPPRPPPAATAATATAPPPARPGIDPSIVDRTASPCADFYQFACGGWLARTALPADKARWVRSFNVMEEENLDRLHGMLDAEVGGKLDPADRYGPKVVDLYASCMDEAAVERTGLGDLRAAWAAADAVRDPASLAAEVGRLHAQGIPALFAIGSVQDARDSSQVTAGIWQAGLSLPDRDFYTKTDAASLSLRQDFLAHVARQLAAAGEPAAQAAADAAVVLRLETALATSYWTRVELRDPTRIYNRLDLAGLERAAPHFDWRSYLAALGAPGLTAITVSTPAAIARLDALVAAEPPESWRAYLRWHLLRAAAAARALPRALSDEAFWFRAHHFTGEREMPARWKHCVETTDHLLGEALGQHFVRRWFPADARAQAVSLVHGIQGAMRDRLARLAWMDDATRGRAEGKLAAMADKIGYPDAWRSYDALTLDRSSFWRSHAAALAFEVRRDLAKIGRPVDRGEWDMTTPTVNAYYNPALNEMVFPAGILQPPFYTQGANDAVNYGAIGLVVGHELTHGFDDEGRQFDARGNLADWWSAPVAAEFDRRAACVVRQYDGYVAVDDVRVNGKLTLGENLADLGGLTLSHAAYQASRAGKPPEAAVGGFTAEQQFFLAHAQAWCALIRPENARLRAVTDPHSPARWRVNGPLSNLPAFARAFSCRAGDPMVRADRCEVW